MGLVWVTAYCACVACCGPGPVRTASGTRPRAGRTVAAPTRVPLHTRLVMRGLGSRVVEDRTGNGRGYDLFVASHAEARRFGRRLIYIRHVRGRGD